MADYNSVPLGQSGTGAAFVLGQSQAANQLLDTIDNNQKVQAQQQLFDKQQAQQIAKSYQDNLFKAKNGQLFSDELRDLTNKHINQGIEYKKQGWDIYNPDPNNPQQMQAYQQYVTDRNRLTNLYDTREAIEKPYLEQQSEISKAGAGIFDPESIAKQHDFVTKNRLQDILANSMQLPYVSKSFDPNSVISKVTPSQYGDEYVLGNKKYKTVKSLVPETTKSLINQWQNTLGAPEYIFKKTGGYSISDLKNMPNSREAIVQGLEEDWDGDRNFRSELAKPPYNIKEKNSIEFKKFVNEKADKDWNAKQIWDSEIESGLTQILPKVKRSESVLPMKEDNWKEKLDYANSLKKKDDVVNPVTIGNIESYVPTIRQDGSRVNEKGSNLFTQNFNNEKVTIKPSKVTDPLTGYSYINTEPFDMNVGSVSMVPVFKDLGNNDKRNGSELSFRQLEEILLGKHKSFKSNNITFNPKVYGTRTVTFSDGSIGTKGVEVPYDAVKGNKNVPTANFDKTFQQFKDATNSPEFKSLTAKQRLDWIKQNFNLK
jgi:hypothetical protein